MASGPELEYGLSLATEEKPSATVVSCPPPRAMTDMSKLFGFYTADPTKSVVDPEKMAEYVKRTWRVSELTRALSAQVAAAADGTGSRAAIRTCIQRHAATWASAHALLAGRDDNTPLGKRQATLIAAWTGLAISNALAVADEIEPIDPTVRQSVGAWFAELSEAIHQDFTPRDRESADRWLDVLGNHHYWAAAAVAAMAIQRNDRTDFGWGTALLRRAIAAAPRDGALPREIKRGVRGLHYQNYATSALAVLVRFADANKVALSPEEETKLAAIFRFSLQSYDNPALIQRETGFEQEKKASMLTWTFAVADRYRGRDRALWKSLIYKTRLRELAQFDGCNTVCVPVLRQLLRKKGAK